MNNIRQVQELNKRELENGVSPDASWHADYRDTAYIYIGGLPFELSEGDVVTIFSQFGEPMYIKLVRDKETGKSRGFAFLKYEDQRSTDLAVDNLGGAIILGRTLRVDHTRYKKRDDESDDGHELNDGIHGMRSKQAENNGRIRGSEDSEERQQLAEERELAVLIAEHDEGDPMKPFLIEEMKEKLALARNREEKDQQRTPSRHGHHRHKSRRGPEWDSKYGHRRPHHQSTKYSSQRKSSIERGTDSKHHYEQWREAGDVRHNSGRRANRDHGARSRSVDSSREQQIDASQRRRRR